MKKHYLKRTWVNPKLKAGKSKIHGNGVFAKEKISQGETLMEFGGELISENEAFSGNYRIYSVWIASPGHYLALPNSDTKESLDENLNHSCDANAWLTDEVTLIAKKEINIGEEITLDQGTWNFDDTYTDDEEPCYCGAKDCRHILTENDWKLSAVQERYRDHFHPIIQEMIDTNRDGSFSAKNKPQENL